MLQHIKINKTCRSGGCK